MVINTLLAFFTLQKNSVTVGDYLFLTYFQINSLLQEPPFLHKNGVKSVDMKIWTEEVKTTLMRLA